MHRPRVARHVGPMRNRRVVLHVLAATVLARAALPWTALPAQTAASRVVFNDVHFHLTNYVQRGTNIRDFVRMMGDSVGRVALFGIPLQQEWLYSVTGDKAPTYYLHSDAPLYY